MSKKTEINTQTSEYNEKIVKISGYRDLIGNELFTKLEDRVKSFQRDAENAIDENRLMRIGIIGQIKRGKSSFLNALFFEGKDVLPKAATPMTAALTRINYAKESKAQVEYYTEKEWQDIKRKAAEAKEIEKSNEEIKQQRKNSLNKLKGFLNNNQHDSELRIIQELSTDQKSCLELVKMAKKNNLNIQDLLGSKQEITEVDTQEELIIKLGNYVGSEGRYTPLVKSTELSLDIESLKNIEIVDTPGMNDPIVSRARKTEEFMGQCDVIFLLSYSSQFLDITDMKLLAQNIPSKGIKDIVLVGSIFDSVLLDEYEKYGSIGEALQGLTQKKNREAKSNFEKVKDGIGKKSLKDALDSAFPPIFISSMCYNIAKHFDNLNAEEQKTLDNLNSMYEGLILNEDYLNALANFEEIDEKFESVKKNKSKILSERFSNILIGFKDGFSEEANLIKKNLVQKKEKLEDGDIDTLVKKQEVIALKLKTGTTKVDGVFEKHIIYSEKKFAELLLGVEESANAARRVKSTTATETTSYQVSSSKWWNPFSWGSSKTEYNTFTYAYANVNEAVELLEDYVSQNKRILIDAIKEIVNIRQFRIDVTESIKDLFDFSDDSFDPDDVLIPVENAVNRITIPSISLDVEKHINTVRNQFQSSQVRDDEIASLRNEQARVVAIITKDIKAEVSVVLNKTVSKLNEIKNSFIPGLTKNMEEMVKEISEQIENREGYLKKYNEIITIIENL